MFARSHVCASSNSGSAYSHRRRLVREEQKRRRAVVGKSNWRQRMPAGFLGSCRQMAAGKFVMRPDNVFPKFLRHRSPAVAHGTGRVAPRICVYGIGVVSPVAQYCWRARAPRLAKILPASRSSRKVNLESGFRTWPYCSIISRSCFLKPAI